MPEAAHRQSLRLLADMPRAPKQLKLPMIPEWAEIAAEPSLQMLH